MGTTGRSPRLRSSWRPHRPLWSPGALRGRAAPPAQWNDPTRPMGLITPGLRQRGRTSGTCDRLPRPLGKIRPPTCPPRVAVAMFSAAATSSASGSSARPCSPWPAPCSAAPAGPASPARSLRARDRTRPPGPRPRPCRGRRDPPPPGRWACRPPSRCVQPAPSRSSASNLRRLSAVPVNFRPRPPRYEGEGHRRPPLPVGRPVPVHIVDDSRLRPASANGGRRRDAACGGGVQHALGLRRPIPTGWREAGPAAGSE